MRRTVTALAGLSLVVVTSLATPRPAAAGVTMIAVTTTVDAIAVDGACSLREAVIAANTNAPVDTCPAGSASELDHIGLLASTYVLTIAGPGEDASATGDLDLLGSVGIDGPFDGGTAAIDAAGLDRAFDVHASANRVFFRNVTIAKGAVVGEDGGAIRLAAGSALDQDGDCTGDLDVELNEAVVRDSVADRGGGIFAGQCTNVDAEWSSVVDNSALGDGGGLAMDGEVAGANFLNSTISGNVAAGRGGGLWGGGLVTGGLFLTTIAHNQAGQGGGVALEASSFRSFSIVNSIVADNGGGDCWLETGQEADLHYSLDSDGTCGDGPGVIASADPLLLPRDTDPVAYRLAPGSPAIDAADSVCPLGLFEEADQYHTPRPLDGDGDGEATCDMGSSEAPEVAVEPTPPPTDVGGGGVTLPDTALTPRHAPEPSVTFAGLAMLLGAGVLVLQRRYASADRPS